MTAKLTAIAGAAILVALGGCQTDGPKDSTGGRIELSAWQDIRPQEADLNIADNLPQGMLTRTEKRTRDNALSHNRFVLSGPGGTGSIMTEYLSVGFYRMAVNDRFKNKDEFVADVEKNFGKPQDVFPIYWRKNLSGYGAIVAASANRSCYVAATGYKFNPAGYDNDFGQFDTTMRANYCGPKVDRADFEPVFANLAKNRK